MQPIFLVERMASNSTNKSRRTAADTLHISDLPVGFIVDVSAYLPKPSRAILAVAFTTSSSSSLWQTDYEVMHQLSPISKAIIAAQQWDILDFQDVNKELANKLTDNDISAVLKSIDAHDVLKRLKLCGCINITGIGLYPLRGSVVLEQLDISFARKHKTQYIDPEPKISHELVMPILQSIISADECSLKYIQFPMKWRNGYTNDGLLELLIQFEQEYNTLLANRELKCAKCTAEMMGNMFFGERYSMLQNNVCYDCLKPFCDDCNTDEDGYGVGSLNFCARCNKDYCVDCVSRAECVVLSCRAALCSGCAETWGCQQCNENKCESCLYTCDVCKETRCNDCASIHGCENIMYCDKAHCSDCYNGEEYDVTTCEECGLDFCSSCRLGNVKEEGLDGCPSCAAEVDPTLYKAILRKENEELEQRLQRMHC